MSNKQLIIKNGKSNELMTDFLPAAAVAVTAAATNAAATIIDDSASATQII